MEKGIVRIQLDERWTLEDFSIFSKQYIQVYGFFHALKKVEDSGLAIQYEGMPWLGGASVVHFFNGMKSQIHPSNFPTVKQIQYASPGFMELTAIIDVAENIRNLVLAICSSAGAVSTTYHVIHLQYKKRQLTQKKYREMDNEKDKEFVRDSVLELHEKLNLTLKQVRALSKISKGDHLIELKMLMAMYRRAKPIADLQMSNKAQLK